MEALKKWGVYNTFHNIDEINNLHEFELWRRIYNLKRFISTAKNSKEENWTSFITKQDLLDAEYNLDYLIYQTRKYGVN